MRASLCAVILAVLLLAPAVGEGQCCGDCNGDGTVTINELVAAVGNALGQCRGGPTPTPTPPPAGQGVTGTWDGGFVSQIVPMDPRPFRLVLTEDRQGNVTGEAFINSDCWAALAVTGQFVGDVLQLDLTAPGVLVLVDSIILPSDVMTGQYSVSQGGACAGDRGTFSAAR